MKVTEHFDQASEPLISYEIIPPKRGGSADQILRVVEELMPFDPPFIDVTSHSAEVEYKQQDDGTWQRCVKRKRPGTIGLCAAIEARFGIDTVPHLLCKGFTREETEDALIELNYLGVENVLAIRGDDKGYEKSISGNRSRNEQAVDLVRQIQDMNQGTYLEDMMNAEPTDFCVGVGGYPETHFEAPNLAWDIMRLKEKVDAGADYIVTQMFFDNEYFFNFVDKCREVGIDVPIVPGIKILKRKRHLRLLPKYFHTEIPEELAAEVDAADPDDVENIGVDWAIRQTRELMEASVPCMHFYIMSSAGTVKKVVEPLHEMAQAGFEGGELKNLIMINFGSSFLRDEYQDDDDPAREGASQFVERKGLSRGDSAAIRYYQKQRRAHPIGTVGDVADHIDHVVDLVGIEHVGLGYDYDGVFTLPANLQDVRAYPNLIEELLRRGYTEDEIAKILGGNLLRVWKGVEQVAEQLQAQTAEE